MGNEMTFNVFVHYKEWFYRWKYRDSRYAGNERLYGPFSTREDAEADIQKRQNEDRW